MLTFNEQGRAAIESFVAGMDGDRARRTKWNGLAAELDAELNIVKVRPSDLRLIQTTVCDSCMYTPGVSIIWRAPLLLRCLSLLAGHR